MAYRALYRQWRPQTFEDMVGQEHVVRILQNSIRDDRIAHAYLFSGPRGTGKTSAAKLFAKALNCELGPTPNPCDQCKMCEKVRTGHLMDVLEIDAASNRGIEEIRELRERVNFAPGEGRYKVYIIDEVHMLTPEAFNALLKTLEEPPSRVVFILATTESQKVPATILSRCQRLEFKRISENDIAEMLKAVIDKEGISAGETELKLIAHAARGGMRDALSILEQCMAFSGSVLTEKDIYQVIGIVDVTWLLKFTDAIITSDLVEGLKIIGALEMEGRKLFEFTKDLTAHLRNLLIIQQLPESFDELLYISQRDKERFLKQAKGLSYEELIRTINILVDTAGKMRWEQNEQIILEMGLIQILRPQVSVDDADMLERLNIVEKRLSELCVSRQSALDISSAQESMAPDQNQSKDIVLENDAVQESVVVESNNGSDNDILSHDSSIPDWWKRVKKRLKAERQDLFSYLDKSGSAELKGDSVVIAIENEIFVHRVDTPRNRQDIESIASDVLGKPVRVIVIAASDRALSSNENDTKNGAEVEQIESLLEYAKDLFGGTIVDQD
jgi:DNA polymerase-3 subunit gamma/tau